MKTRIAVLLLIGIVCLAAANNAVERCNVAARLLDEIMSTPEQSIPLELLGRADCVAIIPAVKKIGFVFGGRYGKGLLACRGQDGQGWTGPSTVKLEGGSIGLQLGGSSTDVVLLVMNRQGVEKLLSNKFTLGVDAAIAGGPVGRSAQAQTDAQMHAKILSYSRSRGAFAGVSLGGATLRPDYDANDRIYSRKVSHKAILSGRIPAPESARPLLAALEKYSAEAVSARKDEPQEDPADLSRKAQAVLRIESEPRGAEVELNTVFNGLTPRAKSVKPGEYEVRLTKKGFEEWVRSVTLEPGETLTLNAELQVVPAAPPREAEPSPHAARNSVIRIDGHLGPQATKRR